MSNYFGDIRDNVVDKALRSEATIDDALESIFATYMKIDSEKSYETAYGNHVVHESIFNKEDNKMSENAREETGTVTTVKYDDISHPSHYCDGRLFEPRRVIWDWGLNWNLGNALKYISRAGRKGDAIQDLEKAIQFIKFEIEDLERMKAINKLNGDV